MNTVNDWLNKWIHFEGETYSTVRMFIHDAKHQLPQKMHQAEVLSGQNLLFLDWGMKLMEGSILVEILLLQMILLMEEILHHLGCTNLVNNGISYILTGARFLPSTLVWVWVLFVAFSIVFRILSVHSLWLTLLSFLHITLARMSLGCKL